MGRRRKTDNGAGLALIVGLFIAVAMAIGGLFKWAQKSRLEDKANEADLSYEDLLLSPSWKRWLFRFSALVNTFALSFYILRQNDQASSEAIAYGLIISLGLFVFCLLGGTSFSRFWAFPLGEIVNLLWSSLVAPGYRSSQEKKLLKLVQPHMDLIYKFVQAHGTNANGLPRPVSSPLLLENDTIETFYKICIANGLKVPFNGFKTIVFEQGKLYSISKFNTYFLEKHPKVQTTQNISEWIACYLDDFEYDDRYISNFAACIVVTLKDRNAQNSAIEIRNRIMNEREKRAETRKIERLKAQLNNGKASTNISIDDVDFIDGHEFEGVLEALFSDMGYKVSPTAQTQDQGGDIILEKNGERIVVQAKRYSENVGNKAVQEVVAAKTYYRCSRAMVVTNQYYTVYAKKLASSNSVELVDRDQLRDWLRQFPQNAALKAS